MTRWLRAARLLALPQDSKVLDLGCAFGFGTRYLPKRYETYGHDLNPEYVERARRMVLAGTFTCGQADTVPYPDAFFDGVLLLDVIEHVPDERAVVDEIARLLRPGGQLILSVPNKGLLGWLDSLNVYQRLTQRVPGSRAPAPTDDPSWPDVRMHRHYSLADIEKLLGRRFRIQSVHYSGLGVAEIVNLQLLLLFQALLRLPRVYNLLIYLYFGMYVLEDLIPAGPWGYHMMLDVQRI